MQISQVGFGQGGEKVEKSSTGLPVRLLMGLTTSVPMVLLPPPEKLKS